MRIRPTKQSRNEPDHRIGNRIAAQHQGRINLFNRSAGPRDLGAWHNHQNMEGARAFQHPLNRHAPDTGNFDAVFLFQLLVNRRHRPFQSVVLLHETLRYHTIPVNGLDQQQSLANSQSRTHLNAPWVFLPVESCPRCTHFTRAQMRKVVFTIAHSNSSRFVEKKKNEKRATEIAREHLTAQPVLYHGSKYFQIFRG